MLVLVYLHGMMLATRSGICLLCLLRWQFNYHRPLSRRLDRCDRVIPNESRVFQSCAFIFSPSCNLHCDVTMQITLITRKFRNVEHNLHCDVVHITTKWVSSLTLDCNGVFAIKAYWLWVYQFYRAELLMRDVALDTSLIFHFHCCRQIIIILQCLLTNSQVFHFHVYDSRD